MDNKNTMLHYGGTKQQILLVNAWINLRKEITVFDFLIACTEVYSFLCLKYFLKKDEEFRVLRLRLAYIRINNELLGNRSDIDNLEGIRKKKRVHHLETEPAHAKKWRRSNWDCSEKYRYQQYICRGNK